jgi:hypothetical protein
MSSPESGPSRRRPAEADSSSSTSLSVELVRTFPKAADRKGTANATRKIRSRAILTDTPVKAALQDKQKLTQVTKGKTLQKGNKRCLFNKAARDSKKKQTVRKIRKDCSDENAWKTFCLICMDRYSKSLAREIWVQCTSVKCGPMKNALLAFLGRIFSPTASRIYQMKISEDLWTYISELSFIFQCNLECLSLVFYLLKISFSMLLAAKYFSVIYAAHKYFKK